MPLTILPGIIQLARQFGDGLLAGVNEVGILLALIGKRAHAEHAVLALKLNVDAVGDEIRHQRRNADAEIDVIAVAQFPGGARRHLFAGPSHWTLLSFLVVAKSAGSKQSGLDPGSWIASRSLCGLAEGEIGIRNDGGSTASWDPFISA